MTREDIQKNEKDRRRRNRWITDALYCKDAQSLLIANTTRSIAIYEASGMKHNLQWLILSLPNVPLVIHYNQLVISLNFKIYVIQSVCTTTTVLLMVKVFY